MADLSKSLPDNVPGSFFVDSTCIDCDACRQVAPRVFAEASDHSYVHHQPAGEAEEREAYRALLACPTASIGVRGKNRARDAMEDFPQLIADGVYYLGFHSEKSFGASSYFIRHPDGNWMVDSPRYQPHLLKKLEAMGGVRHIFLTHRDDVADADRYAEYFGARRIIHERDRSADKNAEEIVRGDEALPYGPDFLVIPTPGHTRGHMVLLYRERFLFSGDHLWFSGKTGRLGASRTACWYDWGTQTKSMEKLLARDFEWILPGHGRRGRLAPMEMKKQLTELVSSMSSS